MNISVKLFNKIHSAFCVIAAFGILIWNTFDTLHMCAEYQRLQLWANNDELSAASMFVCFAAFVILMVFSNHELPEETEEEES